MSTLKGGDKLRARLRAMGQVFKPVGRSWADSAAQEMRSSVPERTGRLRRSFKRKNATMKRATVAGHYTAFFVDKGPKAHEITAKKGMLVFPYGGRTIYARKVHHRGYRARPFRQRSAEAALRKHPMAEELKKLWNSAA